MAFNPDKLAFYANTSTLLLMASTTILGQVAIQWLRRLKSVHVRVSAQSTQLPLPDKLQRCQWLICFHWFKDASGDAPYEKEISHGLVLLVTFKHFETTTSTRTQSEFITLKNSQPQIPREEERASYFLKLCTQQGGTNNVKESILNYVRHTRH